MVAECAGSPRSGAIAVAACDIEALVEAIHRFSCLAALTGPAIAEAEINPLIVRAAGSGIVAVDASSASAPISPVPAKKSPCLRVTLARARALR